MFESKAKIKTLNFLQHIEYLQQKATDRIVNGYQQTEKELIHRFTKEARDLIEHNEWDIALENLLENIYEIDFTIDKPAVDFAKDAIKACGMDYSKWTFIEDLTN
ncbi:MafI family immunity protein [Ohtaekwangia kribbensis]|jgi:hypothetical protein|uniref:MafI family immunity protein n=1 Tax=Ohtaekwangia kribbensis TaxID=688913 RepID=A0ABW3JZ14_9BACT